MGTQQFCLRWNNHQTNMLNVFDQLLRSGEFVDVTLACEGLSIKAHKVVLSACSPYFQSLLRENPCKHPIVILKDMRYIELRTIIDFMYKGEINVSQEQLTSLLKTAETLKVKGLAEVSSGTFPSSQGEAASSVVEELSVPAAAQEDVRSPQTLQDGRVSPYSKRKRHRPSRRLSSDTNVDVQAQPLEAPYDSSVDGPSTREAISDAGSSGDPESLVTPKQEPMELLTEPAVELTMDSDSRYHPLDIPLMSRSQSHDSRERDSGFPSHEDGLISTSSHPSTSTAQIVGQDSGRSRRWKPADMGLAIEAVRAGFGIKSASKQYGIPTMTLWRWTQKCGITSVFSSCSGGRKPRCVGGNPAAKPRMYPVATTLPPSSGPVGSCAAPRGRRRPPSATFAIIQRASLKVENNA